MTGSFPPELVRTPPVLEVSGLRVHLKSPAGTVRAVDGVSFDLRRGETLGIVGESGSGKTVLGRSILALHDPQALALREGQIRLNGVDLLGLTDKQLRSVRGREVSMVFQDPMTSLNPVVRIGSQIAEQLRVHLGQSRKEARAYAADLLGSVGLPNPRRLLDAFPHELSGGMRQRVMIAMAISCEPSVLIADEPTTALDVTVQRQILDLLQEQAARTRMAMILISHDLSIVAGRTDRIAVMYAGRIVENAPTPALFEHPRMRYSEALLAAIPRLEAPSHTRLRVIPGQPPSLVGDRSGCAFAPRCEFVGSRCLTEEPVLEAAAGSSEHRFRCWHPAEEPFAAYLAAATRAEVR